jgi:NADH:ubiquinone reductase (H+-translocating)
MATDSAMSTGQLINARLAISRLGEQEQGALTAAEEAEQEAAG